MDCELVTVGTELVLGQTVDTNAAELGRALAEAGLRLRRATTVPDEAAEIRAAVSAALDRCGTVIVTGGLGPTRDDLTRPAVAELLGRRLIRDPALLSSLEEQFRRRGISPMPESNRTQADVPEGATVLPNQLGTAPGLWIEDERGRLAVLLPGVPHEMRGLLAGEVLPRLVRRAESATPGAAPHRAMRPPAEAEKGLGAGAPERARTVIRSRTVRTAGVSESALADRLAGFEARLGRSVTLSWLPSTDGVDLRLTAWDLPPAEADAALEKAAEALRRQVGSPVYGEGGDDLAAVILDLLARHGSTLAVAESCTGGLLGARLTAVPGSSRVFLGGVVAYDNAVKLDLLGVSADTLVEHGAVSEAVVREMVEGAARLLGAGAVIGVTGIAGPDGGTPEKPVGTVWLGVRWQDRVRAFTHLFPGPRDAVRARSAQFALDYLRRVVEGTL
jgi:nicotinamide-nucleotide amidase